MIVGQKRKSFIIFFRGGLISLCSTFNDVAPEPDSSAKAYRYFRSSMVNCNAVAIQSITEVDILMSLPCSSHVYQVVLTPARWATSSFRRPGVLLRMPGAKPIDSSRMLVGFAFKKVDSVWSLVSRSILSITFFITSLSWCSLYYNKQ